MSPYYLLAALLELQFFEGQAHGALAIIASASVFVLFNDEFLGQF